MMLRIPIGTEDFKDIREQFYFVDKSSFISEFFRRRAAVTLINHKHVGFNLAKVNQLEVVEANPLVCAAGRNVHSNWSLIFFIPQVGIAC